MHIVFASDLVDSVEFFGRFERYFELELLAKLSAFFSSPKNLHKLGSLYLSLWSSFRGSS